MTYSIETVASTRATLPSLIEQAAAALAAATTAAEVLDAKNKAGFAYATAKAAARLAEVKNAHDAVVAACHKAMGDALIIQAAAQCRLADEDDAAQERGEIAKSGQQDRVRDRVPNGSTIQTTAEVGLTRKQVFEMRAVRDAEKERPGVVRKAVEDRLEAGRGPTLADVNRAIAPAPAQPREAAPCPAASPSVRPPSGATKYVYIVPVDDEDWESVVPSKRLEELGRKYNELADRFDVVADGYRELETENAKNIADYNELAQRLDMLVNAITATGLLPIENEDGPEPKLVIADLDKTNAWLKEARAEWSSDRMRRAAAMFVNLPPEASWKEIMPHYREEDSSESETPVTPDPAPEPSQDAEGAFPDSPEAP